MKTLLVLRHAKSSWKEPDLPDHDRPLNERGKRDAPRMGRLLRSEGIAPDLVLCSSAKRARQTATRLLKATGSDGDVSLSEDLFHAGPRDIADVVQGLGGDHACVMVIGHNPGLESFVEELTGVDTTLPTAALAVIEMPIERWAELRLDESGRLQQLWRPRELPD